MTTVATLSPAEYGELLADREPALTEEQIEQAARILAPLTTGPTPGT